MGISAVQMAAGGGYKVVHMVPNGELTTLPKYNDMVRQKYKLSANNTRAENSVLRATGESDRMSATDGARARTIFARTTPSTRLMTLQ